MRLRPGWTRKAVLRAFQEGAHVHHLACSAVELPVTDERPWPIRLAVMEKHIERIIRREAKR